MFPWEDYPRYRVSPTQSSDLRHADITRQIETWATAKPQAIRVQALGKSVEGRPISLLTLGSGPHSVFAWSQMHGDEPTHTAALLDLVNFLLEAPEHPTASAILSGCTLNLTVMLNPDGAERWTRRNAQDLDINRDARHLQTPEGRILHAAVESLRPEFALNLHNQRPRTTVNNTQQVASYSLLVPPIDAVESKTENVLRAESLAGYVAKAVAPHCPGPVSRYNADFMPRCFGEWVQQQGASTITIEAGGWSTVSSEPLVHLHFFGLVTCLEAIATNAFAEFPTSVYEALPRTGEHDLFDHLLRNVIALDGKHEPYRADIGINTVHGQREQGSVVDLGDLNVTAGKTVTDVPDLLCMPGRIAWRADISPTQLPDQDAIIDLLSVGATTVLGQVDVSSAAQVEAFANLPQNLQLPINVGFLAKSSNWFEATPELLLKAIAAGILGAAADDLPAEARTYLQSFDLSAISRDELESWNSVPATLQQSAAQTYECARRFQLVDRGSIALGAVADFVSVRVPSFNRVSEACIGDDLYQVLVAGNVVEDQGSLTGATPGVLLTNPFPRNRRDA